MPEELVWTERVQSDLLRAASAASPRECAAVLGGEAAGARTAITSLIEVPNAHPEPDAFEITPADFARAQRALEDRGAAFIGFAHSHPRGAAAPSLRDRAELWTGCVHLIAGGEQVRAFWLDVDRTVRALPLLRAGVPK
ncbi:MAG: M67 family metallopeptidase [Planctomycetota bacterium]|nr:M67 family metallopeptidase [Planctomycetota bacterium]